MRFLVLTGILFSTFTLAQPGEFLTNELTTNHLLTKDQVRNTVIDNFVFLPDTVGLPFIDDFSTNKFYHFDVAISDSNVSDTLFISLYDQTNTIPEPYGSAYMDDTTYRIFRDTLQDGSISDSLVPLPSKTIIVYDLSTYPMFFSSEEVWPAYEILDSTKLNIADLPDTLFESDPDYVQDSLRYYFVEPLPSDSVDYLWEDRTACRNLRYGINPPSVGVATFDGLDENGYPYVFGSSTAQGLADQLTSKALFMGNPIDSVYLSFCYQGTGHGNEPEAEDSLVLEFWVPDSAHWEHIWSVPGPGTAKDTFEYVHIKLDKEHFYADGFQFRFKNYASLSGNLDHWNIDYVYLGKFRTVNDTSVNDVAFVTPHNGLLREYTAMPWKHYKWDIHAPLVDTSYHTTLNLDFINTASVQNLPASKLSVDYNGTNITTDALLNFGGNILPRDFYPTNYELNGSFSFDTNLADTMAMFDVSSICTSSHNFLQENDTIRFKQTFSNYYAYDDGSAEAAYGPFGGGSRLAYQFHVDQEDSLRSLLMHFSPSVNDVSQKLMRLTVWDDNNGEPGNVIYITPALSGESPIYSNDKNGFVEYFFHQDQRVAVNGTYYVGWTQSDPDVLNIGFDRNIDNSDKIFYNTSTNWINTSFEGSLMIRPVFVSDLDGFLSIDENNVLQLDVDVYPNPANDILNINVMDPLSTKVTIMDLNGRVLIDEPVGSGRLEIGSLVPGMYLVRVVNTQTAATKTIKIIKQ